MGGGAHRPRDDQLQDASPALWTAGQMLGRCWRSEELAGRRRGSRKEAKEATGRGTRDGRREEVLLGRSHQPALRQQEAKPLVGMAGQSRGDVPAARLEEARGARPAVRCCCVWRRLRGRHEGEGGVRKESCGDRARFPGS